jgi:hypothetical protein
MNYELLSKKMQERFGDAETPILRNSRMVPCRCYKEGYMYINIYIYIMVGQHSPARILLISHNAGDRFDIGNLRNI